MKPKYPLSKSRHHPVAVSGLLFFSLTCALPALDNLWTGGSTDWNDPANWEQGRVPAFENGVAPGDYDDAVINGAEPDMRTVTIVEDISVLPRDIIVGTGEGADGVVNHVSGAASTGGVAWVYIGRAGGSGVYNLADTTSAGYGITGFGQGSGTLTSRGRLYVGGYYSGGYGVLNVNTSGGVPVASLLQVGHETGEGVLNLENGAVSAGDWVEFGNGAGARGTFNMSGGSFTKTGSNHFSIGTNGGVGVADVSGGSISVNNEFWVGQNTSSFGSLTFSGGLISVGNYVAIGRNNGSGVVEMSGGEWIKHGSGNFIVGASGPGSMVQTGGLVDVQTGITWVAEQNNCTGSLTLSGDADFRTSRIVIGVVDGTNGTLSLDGGVLRVGRITGGSGAGVVYFNGATILPTMSEASFVSSMKAGSAVLDLDGLVMDTGPFDIGIPQDLSGYGPVFKSGSGTLTLSGPNTYSGGNYIEEGKLVLSTATEFAGDCDLADGAALGVMQLTPDRSLTVDNAILGGLPGTATTLELDLGNAPGNPTAPPLKIRDTLTMGGEVTIHVTDAMPAPGFIPLVSYPLPKYGAGVFKLGRVPLGTTGHLVDNGAGLISLSLDSVHLLKWTGAAASGSKGAWDSTTLNWDDRVNGGAALYADPGTVLFTDTASLFRVELAHPVSPDQVVLENETANYRLEAAKDSGGKITGGGSFIKRGAGPLTLNLNDNDYTGATRLQGGIVTVTTLADAGQPSAIGAASADPANLILGGGTLNYTGKDVSTTRGFTVTGSNSAISNTNAITIHGQILSTGGNLTKRGKGTLTFQHPGKNSFGLSSPGLRVEEGAIVLDGGGTQENHSGGDAWIGCLPGKAGHLELKNTSLEIGGLLTIGRGNGATGTNSTLTAVGSNVLTNGFRTGALGDEALNNSVQTVTLTDTVWTDAAATRLSEAARAATTMTLAGNTVFTAAAGLRMAHGTGGTATLTIQDNATLDKTGSWLSIGEASTGAATVIVKDNGSLISGTGDFNVSDGGTSRGTLLIQDNATVHSTYITYIGKGSGTKGVLTLTGGSFTGDNWIAIGRYTGSDGPGVGEVTVSGGTFNQTNQSTKLIVGEEGSGSLTINGAGVVNSFGGLSVPHHSSGSGAVHLDGGVLNTVSVRGGLAWGEFHFNGGQLIAAEGAAADFMSGISQVTIGAPGALIDTNGQDIAIRQDLLPAEGLEYPEEDGGLLKTGAGTLFLDGWHSYTGPTIVREGALAGTGSYYGPITIETGAALNPGSPDGVMWVDNLTMESGTTFIANMEPAQAMVEATTLDISGATLEFNGVPHLPVHVIARYGILTGHFASVPELPENYTLHYDYAENGAMEIAITRPADAYEKWAQANIIDRDPYADASADGDPDGDGFSNLAEFALDSDPLSGEASGKVVAKIAPVNGSPALVLSLPVLNGAVFSGATEQVSQNMEGLIYAVQGSTDLAAWTRSISEVTGADKTAIETGLPALNTGWTYRTFRAQGQVADTPAESLRVAIRPAD